MATPSRINNRGLPQVDTAGDNPNTQGRGQKSRREEHATAFDKAFNHFSTSYRKRLREESEVEYDEAFNLIFTSYHERHEFMSRMRRGMEKQRSEEEEEIRVREFEFKEHEKKFQESEISFKAAEDRYLKEQAHFRNILVQFEKYSYKHVFRKSEEEFKKLGSVKEEAGPYY